jgi:plastocyanin
MSSMKKLLSLLFAFTIILAVACGGGKESASKSDEGEDEGGEEATATTAASTAAAPAAAPAAVAADAATLSGSIKLEGTPPVMPVIPMGADSVCQAAHPTPAKAEDVVVGAAGELANVLVYIRPEDVKGTYPPPATAEVLNQQGCRYYPHVHAIQVGQKLEIKNSDPTLHNVHCMAKTNSEFNVGQPVQGMTSEKTFDKVEIPIKFKCDVHGWMNSYLAVLPHPFYAVSAPNGTFTIPNLPPGTYTLIAWHEKYGEQKQQITVGSKETKQVAFTFKAS